MRGCTNRTEPAMTLMFQVTASPAPGPFTVSCVLPTARPVSVPVCGSKLAIAGSATLQRSGASGTGVLSAVSACASNFAVPVSGTATSGTRGGRTESLSTTLWTLTSMLLFCSNPDTVSAALPGPTAVTTPARLTRATL